jgi:gamma-glutamyltranspeptidase/glutathione hydrolase
VAEALAHGFADRARLFGDASATREMIEAVLDPASLAAIAATIELDRHAPRDRFGHLDLAPDGGTSHVCVVDAAGNAVALTTTVNGWFGSKLVTPSGIVLNNEIDDFAIAAGVPNSFGLIQSEHNLIAAGKRPLSSMSPTLLFDADGDVVGCVGGSGGPYIISSVVQVLLDVFVHGADVADAVAAPRIHQQWRPDELIYEAEIPRAVRDDLARRGHTLVESTRETAVQAIIVRPDGTREAASDPRKGGAPAAESSSDSRPPAD